MSALNRYGEFLIPLILILLGIVMLMTGRDAGRLGGRILMVILGAAVAIAVFFLVVQLTIQE
jgi:hypothetical protein